MIATVAAILAGGSVYAVQNGAERLHDFPTARDTCSAGNVGARRCPRVALPPESEVTLEVAAGELTSEQYREMLVDLQWEETPLAVADYRDAIRAFLKEDQTLAADDYRIWSDVALATRLLALATSPANANLELDAVFGEFGTSKLRSHVWSILPTGAIQRLGKGAYWRFDIYGPRTNYPEIRSAAQAFIAANPDDPFVDFAHYLIGDFEGALRANPDSILVHILHYALGYQTVLDLVHRALPIIKDRMPADADEYTVETLEGLLAADPGDPEPDPDLPFVDYSLSLVNDYPEALDGQPLSAFLPDFSDRVMEARSHFETIPHSVTLVDDAAHMGAWLDLQIGDLHHALTFISKGTESYRLHQDSNDDGWTDYEGSLHRLAMTVLERLSPDEQIAALQNDPVLVSETSLWYATARAAYRKFDYAHALRLAEAALNALGLPSEQMPATTNPDQINAAIERMDPNLADDLNVVELPYLVEASRELGDFADFLANIGSSDPEALSTRARRLIVKYSKLIDRPPGAENTNQDLPEHQDLRQALHLIDATLENTAGNSAFSGLREWLYFRHARIMAVRDPIRVPESIARLEAEFPSSDLLDDVLTEQMVAQAFRLYDVDGAVATFNQILERTPEGNAVDNAFSWLQIILRCNGFGEAADAVNDDIIRFFPLTRHAIYALERRMNPDREISGCGY
jgi:tetratricopeptide (TPR) repeat protein